MGNCYNYTEKQGVAQGLSSPYSRLEPALLLHSVSEMPKKTGGKRDLSSPLRGLEGGGPEFRGCVIKREGTPSWPPHPTSILSPQHDILHHEQVFCPIFYLQCVSTARPKGDLSRSQESPLWSKRRLSQAVPLAEQAIDLAITECKRAGQQRCLRNGDFLNVRNMHNGGGGRCAEWGQPIRPSKRRFAVAVDGSPSAFLSNCFAKNHLLKPE